jgi:hypothetical protein
LRTVVTVLLAPDVVTPYFLCNFEWSLDLWKRRYLGPRAAHSFFVLTASVRVLKARAWKNTAIASSDVLKPSKLSTKGSLLVLLLAVALPADILADARVHSQLLRADPHNLPIRKILDPKHFLDGHVCTHFYLRCEMNGSILIIEFIKLRVMF